MAAQAKSLTVAGAEADPRLAETGNRILLDHQRQFQAPEGIFQLPRVESSEEVFEVTIPDGLQLSLVDLATPVAATLSGAKIEARPERGATGQVTIRVSWSYPVPMGAVTFRLRVYASPDGTAPPIIAPITEPGSHIRLRSLIEQDAPVDIAVNGPLAATFREQILERGGQIIGAESMGLRHARAMVVDGGVVEVVVVLAVIAAICIIIGFALFGAVLLMAMERGYNIEDTGYKVAVGEGELSPILSPSNCAESRKKPSLGLTN